jgi:hypothetical protein
VHMHGSRATLNSASVFSFVQSHLSYPPQTVAWESRFLGVGGGGDPRSSIQL